VLTIPLSMSECFAVVRRDSQRRQCVDDRQLRLFHRYARWKDGRLWRRLPCPFYLHRNKRSVGRLRNDLNALLPYAISIICTVSGAHLPAITLNWVANRFNLLQQLRRTRNNLQNTPQLKKRWLQIDETGQMSVEGWYYIVPALLARWQWCYCSDNIIIKLFTHTHTHTHTHVVFLLTL